MLYPTLPVHTHLRYRHRSLRSLRDWRVGESLSDAAATMYAPRPPHRKTVKRVTEEMDDSMEVTSRSQ